MKRVVTRQLLSLLFVSAALPAAAHAQSLQTVMAACAPNIHPTTLAALIRTESGGNPYALSDDGLEGQPWSVRQKTIRSYSPANAVEAEQVATDLIAKGHIVGIGLTQINSRNLARMRLTVRDALDVCKNVRAGALILATFYLDALPRYGQTNDALLAALSAYNTGNFRNGLSNGYVDRVLRAGGMSVPALRVSTNPSSPSRNYGRSNEVRFIPLSSKFAVLDATITR